MRQALRFPVGQRKSRRNRLLVEQSTGQRVKWPALSSRPGFRALWHYLPIRKGFPMKVRTGRHDYSIFMDRSMCLLDGYIEVEDEKL